MQCLGGERGIPCNIVRPAWWQDATPRTSRKDCWFLDAAQGSVKGFEQKKL